MNFKYDRSITFPKGFKAAGVSAGIKENGLPDLGLVASDEGTIGVAVFTRNKFQAAPITLSGRNLASSGSKVRAIIANSGCANALTGKVGMKNAEKTAIEAAKVLQIPRNEVLIASTGVIGRQLPVHEIVDSLPGLARELKTGSDTIFAQSIMTTDKFPKQVAAEFTLAKGKKYRIGGVAKGAGMIHPNMATMLCFVTTDAKVEEAKLRSALSASVDRSFNTITVDGDTSTNDSVFLLASGASGVAVKSDSDYRLFLDALTSILRELAMMIVRDGEGATRFMKLNVRSASNFGDAVKVGRAVGVSPLVKTAIFGGDPNWGRVISAVGNSNVEFDPSKVELRIGNVCVFRGNEPQKVDPAAIKSLFSKKEIEMTIKLNTGRESAEVFTCDLSYDYVKINGEYTT
ncbi:MAG TPA: bifunctional glutamate N-acetyltransferase/amino-acid acetyltransferase ArgJ [Candidatus Kryptonia bacterium]